MEEVLQAPREGRAEAPPGSDLTGREPREEEVRTTRGRGLAGTGEVLMAVAVGQRQEQGHGGPRREDSPVWPDGPRAS